MGADQETPTAPPVAAGVRIGWADLPDAVRGWVADALGSAVTEAAGQVGGFSPGAALRLRCADGTRAFVKAVGTPLNPDSPGMYRDELRLARALPPHPAVPRLLGGYDEDGWVALLFEDVDGHVPSVPWARRDLTAVLDTATDLAAVLGPSPVPGLRDLAESLNGCLGGWRAVADDPPADLDPWIVRHLDRLVALAETPVEPGSALVHLDLRSDNILLTDAGRVCFLDWAHGAKGPAWVDVVLLMLEVEMHGGHDVDAIVAAHPLTRDADPAQVTQVVLAIDEMFQRQSRRPAPPGLPTIRAFQRAYAASTTGWLRRRLGWP